MALLAMQRMLDESGHIDRSHTLKRWLCEGLWHQDHWLEHMIVTTDADGCITSITKADKDHRDESCEKIAGWCIPSLVNSHSHAFQYAMAGTTEHRGHHLNDSFWAWRNTMYQIANRINPQQMLSIAARA